MDETPDRTTSAATPEHDDLLRSSLTESDDAVGFDRPWAPLKLVWVAFFGGLPAAAALYALNFRRLGVPAAALPTFAVGMALFLVAHGFVALRAASGEIESADRRLYRFLLQALSVLFAFVVVALQRRRFRLFEVSGGEGGALLKTGVIAVVASVVLSIGYGILIVFLVHRPA